MYIEFTRIATHDGWMTEGSRSGNGPDELGFRELWPVLFMERMLPGHERADRSLEQTILRQEAAHRGLTTDYVHQNLFASEDPAISWLMQCIHKSATDYCHRAGMTYAIDWTLQGWANVNRRGDYHDPHNHPHAYLSGTYYVRVPRTPSLPDNRADVRPGCITFYDPRGSVNMTAIRDDPQIESELTIAPRAGMMLLWPAFMLHYVHPNLSDELRISVSFNLLLKSPGDYLPAQ